MFAERVLSGMRPTGALHLGHYHGVLKNWVRLQAEYPCFFFVADWHALTTHYETPEVIQESVWEMVIDWLAAGVDPNQATLFMSTPVKTSPLKTTTGSSGPQVNNSAAFLIPPPVPS